MEREREVCPLHFYEYSRDNQGHPSCWESDNPNCYAHFHKSIELLYVLEGSVEASLNGRTFLAEGGELVIIPGYTIHSFQMTDRTRAWLCTIPQDVLNSYKQILLRYTFGNFKVDTRRFGEECPLTGYFQGIKDAMGKAEGQKLCPGDDQGKSLAHQAVMKGYAYLILGYLIDHAGLIPVQSTRMITFCQEVLCYLEENYLGCCGLEMIASHFGYSKSRFSHLFNETFGCRLVEYVNGLRCAHAMTLMEGGEMSITEIALESGFETTRTFYRAFRKYYGIAPSDFYQRFLANS